MNQCQQCQQENPVDANFCNHCGSSLSITIDQPTSIRKKKRTERSAERRQLTILFCDLVGSTPLSQLLDPEEFRQVITSYHQEAETVIAQYNGYIAQYLGDGLLVYFGYPDGLEDAPKLGVQAGLGILKAIAKANQRWKDEGKAPIEIRIGVHTGLVVVDDHLALGETVNTAARLEGMAPHNGLVITPRTLALTKGWFDVISIGKHTLKGITEPLEIFQVLKESGARTKLDVAKNRGLSPLVGRQDELILLENSWLKAKKGAGNLVLLKGEAGIGKSRLVDTIEEQIAADNRIHLVARCSAYQINSAFYPIVEMFENSLLQFEVDDKPADKLNKLEHFLRQTNMDFKPTMSLFAEFLSIPSEHFPALVMSPFAKRQNIMEGISEALLFKTTNHPLLLVIEDLHWADASTLEWLKLFMKQLSGRSIFMLCTTRPNFQHDWKEIEYVSQIDLTRLSYENMSNICHHLTKGKSLPKEILTQITSKTEGVPLFVEELTKMILESDLLIEKSDSYEVAGSLPMMAIPSTLQDSLLARLDRLSDVKEIVQIGAVLGREFSFEILNAVIPQNNRDLRQAISKLQEAEIFYQLDKGKHSVYQFKHALMQESAYESLLKSRRQQLHQQVAVVLEDQFAEITQNQPELLAHHLTEAGKPIEAIPFWLQAGQQASHKNATTEAIAHLEKGLELLPHVQEEADRINLELDFRLTLGGTFVVSHGFPHPKVKETFNRARDIAKTLEVNPKVALVLFNLLSYYFNTEDYQSHGELSDYMLKLAEDPENGYWFELFASQLVGGAWIAKGDFEKANLSYQRVLELFDPSLPFPWELAPSGYIEIGAKSWQMICLQIMGYFDQAKNLSDHHLSYAKYHKDSMTLYHIFTFPALHCLFTREWEKSEKIIGEYLPIVRAFGDPIFTLTAEVYYNVAKAFQGDRAAFDTAVNLINVCFNVGFKTFAVSLSPFIGEQYFHAGEYESAINWIEKILDHTNKTGTHIQTAELLRIKGIILLALGKSETIVEEVFNQALKLSRKQSAKTFELRATGELAKLWKKRGQEKEAYDLLKGVYDWFTEGYDSIDLKEAQVLLNELKQ